MRRDDKTIAFPHSRHTPEPRLAMAETHGTLLGSVIPVQVMLQTPDLLEHFRPGPGR